MEASYEGKSSVRNGSEEESKESLLQSNNDDYQNYQNEYETNKNYNIGLSKNSKYDFFHYSFHYECFCFILNNC